MPPLFTQTFPLDFNGYNEVIKNRPVSFVEILKSDGFKTFMLQGDDNDGHRVVVKGGLIILKPFMIEDSYFKIILKRFYSMK